MKKPKFNIGDEVYILSHETVEKRIVCPHCNGLKYIRILHFDDSIDYIDCKNCELGYNPPRGYVTYYEQSINIIKTSISRVQFYKNEECFDYGTFESYHTDEDNIFVNEQVAQEKAKILVEKINQEELDKILKKEKDTKSWAWNATYHRNQIKKLTKDLEYHTSKLDVAKLKSKDEKEKVILS